MNKRLMILCLSGALVLAGCSNTNDTETENTEETSTTNDVVVEQPSEDKTDNIEDDLAVKEKELVKHFDSLINKGNLKEAIGLYENNVENMTQDNADYLFIVLEGKIKEQQNFLLNEIAYDEEIQQAIFESYLPETEKVDFASYNGPNRALIGKVYNEGMKIYNFGGSFQPVADYNMFIEYDQYHSDYIQNYIKLMAIESNQYAVSDGRLIIGYEELLKRMLSTEDFLVSYKNYRDDNLYKLIMEQYKGYIQFYMITPIHNGGYDAETNAINTNLKESYNYLFDKYGNSISASIIEEFYNYLEKNDFIIDNTIEVFSYDLYEEIPSKFN